MKTIRLGLPEDALKFCHKLAHSVGSGDGFRRQAVPVLLYRYLAGMKATFGNLHRVVRKGGRMAWVVGVNQTTLGDRPIVIDTPLFLSSVASQAGFHIEAHSLANLPTLRRSPRTPSARNRTDLPAMIEFTLHPQVHATGSSRGLIGTVLELAWVREHQPGDGHFVIMSGFGNYNGGVRFLDVFRRHIAKGGRLTAIFGGSTSQRLTSRQIVEELLRCGAEVHLVNRKKILHAKCYGAETSNGDSLIVSSGNFTGPGMSQNIEGSIFLDPPATRAMSFRWRDTLAAVLMQRMAFYRRRSPIALLLLGNCSMTRSLAKSEWTKVRTSLSCWSSATQIPCAFKPRPAPSKHKARNTSGSASCYDFFAPHDSKRSRHQTHLLRASSSWNMWTSGSPHLPGYV